MISSHESPQEPLPLGRTDELLQYSEEIWQDLDDASSRVAALHRAEDAWDGWDGWDGWDWDEDFLLR